MKKTKRIQIRKRLDALSVEITPSHANPATGQVELNVKFDAVNNEYSMSLVHSGEILNSVSQVSGYFGENKIRILSEIPKDVDDHSINLSKKIARFDKIIGIDTNTIQVEETKVSIGIACYLIYENSEDYKGWGFKPIHNPFAIIGSTLVKIENYNWRELINHIKLNKEYDSNNLIGIVVDSDLENVGNYNKRLLPIIDDFYLPPNFELIYASDKAVDSPLNGLIKHCHKLASQILSIVKNNMKKD